MKRETLGRHALLGLGFFAIFLSPFLGFNKVSYMATVWVMDHFLYLPIIGVIGLAVALSGAIDDRLPRDWRQLAVRAAGGLILFLLVLKSHDYAKKFVNEESLYRYASRANPQAWQARYILGLDLLKRDAFPEARKELLAALAIHPGFSKIHLNLGTADARLGLRQESVEQFEEAVQIDAADEQIYDAWGLADFQAGLVAEAIQKYQRSLQLNPKAPPVHTHLGIALCQQGNTEQGIHEFDQARQLNPRDWEPSLNEGVAFAALGRTSEAIAQFETVLRLDPGNSAARSYLEQLQAQPPSVVPH
jgi:tetratricopeptide (TPR) repeat protein